MTAALSHILRRSAICHGSKPAIIDGETTFSWQQFVERVSKLAAVLQSLGLGPNGRVAMLAENSHRYLEFYFGVPWAGGIFTPLNIRLTVGELASSLEHANVDILITDAAMLPLAQQLRERLPRLRHVISSGQVPAGVIDYEQALSGAHGVPEADRSGDDVAALFYTSGTSGTPKGVMLTHENLWTSGLSGIHSYSLHQNSISLVPSPFFHVAAAAMIMPTLMVSGTVVILPKFTPQTALAALTRHKVTTAVIVNALLRMLMSEVGERQIDLPHLETILMGASAMNDQFLAEVFERFGDKRLINAYGMTEATAAITSISHVRGNHGSVRRAANSVGRPVVGVTAGVFDSNDRLLPPGEIGQIWVKGGMVMQGYWNNSTATEDALRDGWLHTGDAGYMDDEGYLFLVDRIKDMIKTGGENVYSAEVERVIFNFPGVDQCAVVGLPDHRWGECVTAVIIPRNGTELDTEALVQYCRSQLAGFKIPRRVEIRTTPFPVNAVNKTRKDLLRAELLQQVT
jgi:long-chain acyl-CoA synthetase